MGDGLQDIDANIAQLRLTSGGEQAELPEFSKEVILDPEGDLRLEIGLIPQCFVVDSRSLARASPVWKAMLRGGWSESRPKDGADWIVRLPEDDQYTMKILLGIVHGIFPRQPELFVSSQLRVLAAAADKYDVVHLLRPFAPTWIKGLKQSKFNQLPVQTCITCLSICWDLGDEALFESLAETIVMQVEIDNEGTLLDPSGNPLEEDPSIPRMDIIGLLLERRKEMIEAILRPVDEILQQYLDGQAPPCRGVILLTDQTGKDKIGSDCSLVILGSLIRELVDLFLFPIPESSDIFESIESLEAKVLGLLGRVKPLGTGSEHHDCNPCPGAASTVRNGVLHKRRELILTSTHRSHIHAQSEKSGCDGLGRRHIGGKVVFKGALGSDDGSE